MKETTPRLKHWIAGLALLNLVLVPVWFYIDSQNYQLRFSYRYGALGSLGLYWLLCALWVYLDARPRNDKAPLWALLCLFTNAMGMLSYRLSMGQNPVLCFRCARPLRPEFKICPYCGPTAFQSCPECEAKLEMEWKWCPYCHTSLERVAKAFAELEDEV